MNGNINLTISRKEISDALPKSLLYNLGDSALFYLNKSQWRYTNEALIVRIPISNNNKKFIYAIKKVNNPDTVRIWLAEYIPAPGQYIDEGNNIYWFTFTTMETRQDGTHPVCGNRQFGLRPHSTGGYEFYISGADRIYGSFFSGINERIFEGLGFDGADLLWSTIQNNTLNDINTNGGLAGYFVKRILKSV